MENLTESPTLRTCALAALGQHVPHDLLSRRESLEAEYLAGFVGRLESIGGPDFSTTSGARPVPHAFTSST